MAKSSHLDGKEGRDSGGRFILVQYPMTDRKNEGNLKPPRAYPDMGHDNKTMPTRSSGFVLGEYSPARRSAVAALKPSQASIPPRASAYPLDVVKVRPRYPRVYTDKGVEEQDVTRIPTMPPAAAVWQYETPHYEAESSLSSLSLAVSKVIKATKPTNVHTPEIDEIDTTPPAQSAILIEDKNRECRDEYVFAHTLKIGRVEKNEVAAGSLQELLHVPTRHPFDRFRWWLLVPGRIELILWICGAVILIGITGLLIFILAVSMGLFQPAVPQSVASNICSSSIDRGKAQNRASNTGNCTLSTVASSSGLKVTMVDGDLMERGNVLQLRGQGFHPLGHVTITHDGNLPCQPGGIQANEHGEFVVAISLDEKKYWGEGKHQITINDTDSKNSIMLTIMVMSQK